MKSNVEAYIDPSDTDSYTQIGGLWLKMDEQIDYDVNRKEGWIRLNNIGTDEAVAIAYTLGRIDDLVIHTQLFLNEIVQWRIDEGS